MILTLLLVQHVAGHVDVDGMVTSVAPADDILAFTNGGIQDPRARWLVWLRSYVARVEKEVIRELPGPERGQGPAGGTDHAGMPFSAARLGVFRPSSCRRALEATGASCGTPRLPWSNI